MDYEVLNKRLDAREDLIHSESPSVHIRPWKGSYMAWVQRRIEAQDSRQAESFIKASHIQPMGQRIH